ncbi:MAG: hypothetical protein Q9175_008381, partial [Cornicularia normoerica]
HNNHWTFTHDVGTRTGNVAEVLGGRKKKVIASNPSDFHTAVTQIRLTVLNVAVEQCGAVDLITLMGPDGDDKADLNTLVKCSSLMDAEEAFSGFAKLLRSGGILAIWFYGRPIFTEDGQEKSQRIYEQIAGKAFSGIFPIKNTTWQQV